MTKETKHLKETSVKAPKTPEQKTEGFSLSDLKKTLNIQKSNPILAYLDMFDKTWKKRKRQLQANELLFAPGEDPHMYLITKGMLVILRETGLGEQREIGTVYTGGFLGEGILFGRNKKDVSAIAKSDGVELFAITKEDLEKLKNTEPQAALDLYEHIIEITNKRLLDTGEELASIYEATNSLTTLSEKLEKEEISFADILQELSKIIGTDYLIYIEQHPAVANLFSYKFDTKTGGKKPINERA